MVLATGRRKCLLRRRLEEERWRAAARGELAVPINGLSFFLRKSMVYQMERENKGERRRI